MGYILTHQSLINSAQVLARGLGLGIYTTMMPQAPAIRWGNSSGATVNDTQYNIAELILLSGNKIKFANTMNTISIPCVEYHTGEPEKYPVCIRTTLNGQGGAGIVIAKNLEEFLLSFLLNSL